LNQGWKSVVRRGRPGAVPRVPRAVRGLALATAGAALAGAQVAVPVIAAADAAPGAPVIAVTAEPPAGTEACQMPSDNGPSTLEIGTVCSFTLSPNPADTSVPTGYEFSYPFNEGDPDHVTAADPGNGNTFDAATGVATITIVLTAAVGSLTVNTIGAGDQVGPATQEYLDGRDPASGVGTPQTFGDFDGDGTPDLLATPLESGDALANGIWFAKGGAGGTVSANAEDLAINAGLGTTASGGPTSFDGAQVISGDWCGTGDTSVLAYYPPSVGPSEFAGGGYVFCGNGESDAVRNAVDSNGPNVISSGSLSDSNGVNPTELIDGGNLAGTGSGIPDVLAVLDNELVLTAAFAPGGYFTDGGFGGGTCDFGDCAVLSNTPSPDGTLDWDSWKVVGYPLSDGDVDMYLWNPTTGELVLWNGVTATDAASDGVWSNYTTLDYTQYVITSGTGTSTWNRGANLELQTADLNGDGVPDLWAASPAAGTVVAYTARIDGSAAKLTADAKQRLVTPAHEWELDDLESGTANQAYDSGSDTAEMLRSSNAGATWTTDKTFGAAVRFDGASGYLQTYTGQPSLGAVVTPGSSFTIGAWVNPSGPGTVLAQDGTDDSMVYLSAAANGTWQFGINTAGTTAATYAQDEAGSWTAGTWTHVVLTYNASNGDLVLYVDGDRADTVHVSGAATTDGPFVVGANQIDGAIGSYFPGEVARVVTFDSALTTEGIKQLP